MTAYADRLQRLAGGEPSLRLRPRSRFEPVLASSEPPWERAAGPQAAVPFELAGGAETAPAEPHGARVPGGRPQAAEEAHSPGRSAGPAARRRRPAAGDFAATAGPATASAHAGRPAGLPGAEQDGSRIPPVRTEHGEAGQTAGPRPEAGRHPAAPDRPAGRASTPRGRRVAAASEPAGPAWRRPGTGSPRESSTSGDPAPGSSPPASPRPASQAPASPRPVSQAPASSGHAPADTADTGPASGPAGSREDRVGQEPGGAAGWGSHLPATDRLGGESAGPGDRPLRYRAAGLGTEELPAGDPARAGTPGLRGAERKTADPGPEALGDVTVTIGRIDVRVAPPQSTASLAAGAPQPGGDGPAEPGPSRLEDYLRARSSGRVG